MCCGSRTIPRPRCPTANTVEAMRFGLKTGAALAAALICLMMGPARAEAAPERAAIVNGLCQGGPGLSQAVDQLLTGLPGATPDDLSWANRVVGAFAHRQLLCSSNGHGYLSSSATGLEAATLAPVPALPADAAAPFPSLRAR